MPAPVDSLDGGATWQGANEQATVNASSQKQYMAFLLRLWREGQTNNWRATLEDPHTGERQGFADLEKLFAFLMLETGQSDSQDGPADGSERQA